MSTGKKSSGGKAASADAYAEWVDDVPPEEEVIAGAKLVCFAPLYALGVQPATPIAFSPAGDLLAFVSNNGSIVIVDMVSRRKQGHFPVKVVLVGGHTLPVRSLLFHESKPELVSVGEEGLFVWNVTTGEMLHKMRSELGKEKEVHESAVMCAQFLFDGTSLVTGSRDNNLMVWDCVKGDYRPMETMYAHKATVTCLAFCSATNTLASAGRDSSIKLWDVITLEPGMRDRRADDSTIKCQVSMSLDAHVGDVVSLTFKEDGSRLFSGARDNYIKVWDTTSGTVLRDIKGHRGDIRRMILINKEKLLLTACIDSQVRVWKLTEQQNAIEDVPQTTEEIMAGGGSAVLDDKSAKDEVLTSFTGHEYDVWACELHKKAKLLVTASSLNEVRIWDASDLLAPKQIYEFVGHSQTITDVKIYGEKRFVSCSEDYNVSVYNMETHVREAHHNFEGSVNCLALSSDGSYCFAGGNHYDIKCYCIASDGDQTDVHSEVARFVGHAGAVTALALSPDNTCLASSGHDFDIKLWPLKLPYHRKNERPVRVKSHSTVTAHRGRVTSLAFNEDGSLLASGGTDHSIIVWKVKTGLLGGLGLSQIWSNEDAHRAVVTSVCFGRGPSADLVLSGSWDSNLVVWRAASGGPPLATVRGHVHKITDLTVSTSGEYALTCSADATIRMWRLEEPYACQVSYIVPQSEGAFNSVSIGTTTFASASESGMIRLWPLYGVDKYASHFQEPPN